MARLVLLFVAVTVVAFLVGVAAGLAYTSHYGDVLVEIEPVPDYIRSIIVNSEQVHVKLEVEPAPGAGRAECVVNVTLFNSKGDILASYLLGVSDAFEVDAGGWPVALVARVVSCEGVTRAWLRVTVSS